jgi:hypothetical protein
MWKPMPLSRRDLLLTVPLALKARAQNAAPNWWAAQPLRIADVLTAIAEITIIPPADAVRRKLALGFNAEHLHVMRFTASGIDETSFYFPTSLATKKNEDYLTPYIDEARKQGLHVFVYFNVHTYTKAFGAKYPDWMQIRENGTVLDGVYQTAVGVCINSPFRDWSFQIARDLAACGADGIFLDGPIFFPETCYCRWCRQEFQKRGGGSALPSKARRKGAPFQELIDFQSQSLARFVSDMKQALAKVGKPLPVYMNGGLLGGNAGTGRMNRVINPAQDLTLNEGGFLYGDLTRVPPWQPSVQARLMETQSGGKPYVTANAAALKSWNVSLLPATELRLMYAQAIAHGAGVYFGIFPSDLDQPEIQTLTAMNRLLADHSEYSHGTKSEARVAIVWPDITANFYDLSEATLIDSYPAQNNSGAGNLRGEFWGLAEAILRTQTPFDVIDDDSLARADLRRYALIILPNVACMSDAVASQLAAYVEGGGNLLATFETSAYDEFGIRRKELALAPVFGVAGTGKLSGLRRWDYMGRPSAGDHAQPWLRDISRVWIPSTPFYAQVRARSAQVLLEFTKPLAGSYELPPELSGDPAITVHSSGRGTAWYCAGDLGNAIQTYHFPELLATVANAVRALAPRALEVSNVPSSVEVVHRSQPGQGRDIVHLLNYTGEMTRPMQRVLPLEGVRLTLPPGKNASRAVTLVRPSRIPLAKDASGRVTCLLPRVDEFETVVFES